MQAVYIISRVSGTLLFSKEFSNDYNQDEGTLEPVVTPARAFTFSPLRNHNTLIGNMSAPQLYWSLYLHMINDDAYDDTYYVTNDTLVIFAHCPYSILTVGIFGAPIAHLSLVVGCHHQDGLTNCGDVAALFQTSIYATDANDTIDDPSIDDGRKIENIVGDYDLIEHADDYVFHTSALVRHIGIEFTTAFSKTLQKCNTDMKSRFMRFESALAVMITEWFGNYILRSISLVMFPTPTESTHSKTQKTNLQYPHMHNVQLLVLTCDIQNPIALNICQTEPVTQEPFDTLIQSTPREEGLHKGQKNMDIIYLNTPILARESPSYRYSIQKTPKRGKTVRKAVSSTPNQYTEDNAKQTDTYFYRVIKVYLETGLCSDPQILSHDFYCCISNIITTMMATEQSIGGNTEDGCASLFVSFSSIKYRLVIFWQDSSRALFTLVLKGPSLNGRHVPFWFPFLLPSLLEL